MSCGYGYPTEKTLNNDRCSGENAELNDWFCRIEMLWYVSGLMWYTIVQKRQAIVGCGQSHSLMHIDCMTFAEENGMLRIVTQLSIVTIAIE